MRKLRLNKDHTIQTGSKRDTKLDYTECPHCEGQNFDRYFTSFTKNRKVLIKAVCINCGGDWIEVYSFEERWTKGRIQAGSVKEEIINIRGSK